MLLMEYPKRALALAMRPEWTQLQVRDLVRTMNATEMVLRSPLVLVRDDLRWASWRVEEGEHVDFVKATRELEAAATILGSQTFVKRSPDTGFARDHSGLRLELVEALYWAQEVGYRFNGSYTDTVFAPVVTVYCHAALEVVAAMKSLLREVPNMAPDRSRYHAGCLNAGLPYLEQLVEEPAFA